MKDAHVYIELSSLSLQHLLILNAIHIGAFENCSCFIELTVPILDDRLYQLVARFSAGKKTVPLQANLDKHFQIEVPAIDNEHGIFIRKSIGIPQAREILQCRNVVGAAREVPVAHRRTRIGIDKKRKIDLWSIESILPSSDHSFENIV